MGANVLFVFYNKHNTFLPNKGLVGKLSYIIG